MAFKSQATSKSSQPPPHPAAHHIHSQPEGAPSLTAEGGPSGAQGDLGEWRISFHSSGADSPSLSGTFYSPLAKVVTVQGQGMRQRPPSPIGASVMDFGGPGSSL